MDTASFLTCKMRVTQQDRGGGASSGPEQVGGFQTQNLKAERAEENGAGSR